MDLFTEAAVFSLTTYAENLLGFRIAFGVVTMLAALIAFWKATRVRSPVHLPFVGFVQVASRRRRAQRRVPKFGQTDLAAVGRRAQAKLIDVAILYVLGISGTIWVQNTLGGSPGPAGDPAFAAYFPSSLIQLLVGVLYTTWFLGRYGATPGKLLCHIRVVRADGSPISYGRAAGRYAAEQLSSIILLVGYFMAAFDPERRTLHDRFCDTRVLQIDRSRKVAVPVSRSARRWPLSRHSPLNQVIILSVAGAVYAIASSGVYPILVQSGIQPVALIAWFAIDLLIKVVLGVLWLVAAARLIATVVRLRAVLISLLLAIVIAATLWRFDPALFAAITNHLVSTFREQAPLNPPVSPSPLPDEREMAPEIYRHPQHHYTMALPPGWREADAEQQDRFEGGTMFENRSAAAFAVVFVEGPVTQNLTKEEVAEAIGRGAEQNGELIGVRVSEVTQPSRNGREWIEFRLDGQTASLDLVYLYALHLGTDQTYTMMAWTAAADYPPNKQTMRELLASLHLPR